jgi:hypothetical protein
MHSAQKPTYAERDDYSHIRLCLDGVLQSPFKATGGSAGGLRGGIVNVLRCINWPQDREQRARIIGDWLRAEARYLA